MKLNRYTQIIYDEAKRQGFKLYRFGRSYNFIAARKDKREWWFYQSMTDATPKISGEILKDKFMTNLFLARYGFPVPPQQLCQKPEDCHSFLGKHKKIVIKPKIGVRGKGITVGITKVKDLKKAFRLARKVNSEVLAEKYLKGIDHRILVIGRKKVFAAQRIAANVLGDGRSNIRKLVRLKNEKRNMNKRIIVLDSVSRAVLKEQKLSVFSVPKKGRRVYLRKNANLATGGEAIDITDDLGMKIKKIAIKISKKLEMDVLGIDFLSEDINNKPAYITELNAIPGIMIHHYPDYGKPRNVAREIIKLFN